MAILKYKGSDGQFIAVNSYKINNVVVAQEKGQSTADVMSQKAVTDDINALETAITNKADKSNVYTKSETDTKLGTKANSSDIPTKVSQLTNDSGYLTTHQDISGKANTSDVYTKTQSDNKYQVKGNYLTSHQSLTDYAKKTDVTTADNQIKQTISDNETAVTAALNKLKQSAGFNASGDYTNSDYSSLADAIDDIVSRLTDVENFEIIDGGEY